jgi:hypothetical protein
VITELTNPLVTGGSIPLVGELKFKRLYKELNKVEYVFKKVFIYDL